MTSIFKQKSLVHIPLIALMMLFSVAESHALAASDLPTFRAYARTFNPNRCNYYSTIEAEVYLETTQEKDIGSLQAYIDLKANYARNSPETWYSLGEDLPFVSYLTHDRTYLYRLKKRFTISSRGSYSYNRLRFQVNQNSADQHMRLPSPKDPRFFYTIDLSGLNPSCNPDDESNLKALPVSIECMDLPGYPQCQPPTTAN